MTVRSPAQTGRFAVFHQRGEVHVGGYVLCSNADVGIPVHAVPVIAGQRALNPARAAELLPRGAVVDSDHGASLQYACYRFQPRRSRKADFPLPAFRGPAKSL